MFWRPPIANPMVEHRLPSCALIAVAAQQLVDLPLATASSMAMHSMLSPQCVEAPKKNLWKWRRKPLRNISTETMRTTP